MAALRSRTASNDGSRRTLRLETDFLDAIQDICTRENYTFADLVARAEAAGNSNRTSAVRVFVLRFYRDKLAQAEAR